MQEMIDDYLRRAQVYLASAHVANGDGRHQLAAENFKQYHLCMSEVKRLKARQEKIRKEQTDEQVRDNR